MPQNANLFGAGFLPIILQVLAFIRQYGPAALPMIEAYVAKIPGLTGAQIAAIDALMESLLGQSLISRKAAGIFGQQCQMPRQAVAAVLSTSQKLDALLVDTAAIKDNLGIPTPPANPLRASVRLRAAALGQTDVTVTWEAPISGAPVAYYTVEYMNPNGGQLVTNTVQATDPLTSTYTMANDGTTDSVQVTSWTASSVPCANPVSVSFTLEAPPPPPPTVPGDPVNVQVVLVPGL